MNSINSPDRAIRLELLVVLGAEIALVVALHLAGSARYTVPVQSLADWFQQSDPTVALVAVARLVALVLAYWLLTTTVLYALAHHLGWDGLADTLRWVTLPVVRRVVQGVTAMSLTGASFLGPATVSIAPALAQEVQVQSIDDGTDADGAGDDEELPATARLPLDAAGWPESSTGGDFWRPTTVSQTQDGSQTLPYTVVSDDHFWSIAETRLREVVGRDVTEDEICQYWVRVVDANRSTIRSGDPDLIFPLESVVLPPVFDN